jgi:hypothetical protein
LPVTSASQGRVWSNTQLSQSLPPRANCAFDCYHTALAGETWTLTVTRGTLRIKDKSTDVRKMFFSENAFVIKEFVRSGDWPEDHAR